MFGHSIILLALVIAVAIASAIYFVLSTTSNSDHPFRGAYVYANGSYNICAPGLFAAEFLGPNADKWQCGELQQCLLKQNRVLSCASRIPEHVLNQTIPSHKVADFDFLDFTLLCLLNMQEYQGKCVSYAQESEPRPNSITELLLHQCEWYNGQWLCQPPRNHSSTVVTTSASLRVGADHRRLQPGQPVGDSPPAVMLHQRAQHRRNARATRVDLYNHRESIKLLDVLLNGKCDSFRACPGQV